MKQINASLFYKEKGGSLSYKETATSFGGFAFDLVLSENHALEAQVAEHPIEVGSAIATHVHNSLRQGELEGLISNWSSIAPLFIDSAVQNFQGLAAGPNRAVAAFQDTLKKIWLEKRLVTIVLGLDTYENCILTRIEANRTPDEGDAQTFRIAFKEVRTVKLATTRLATATSPLNLDEEDNRQASSTADLGKQ